MKKNNIELYKDNIKKILYIILCLIIPIYGVISFFQQETNNYSNILLVFSTLVFIYLYKEKRDNNRLYIFLSIIYALFYVIGTRIDQNYYYSYGMFQNKKSLVLSLYSFSIFIYYIIGYISMIIKKVNYKYSLKKKPIKYFVIITIILFLSYIPYLYSFYPGLISPDSFDQISQAVGAYGFSNHHPVVHTLFITFCINLGKIFGKLEYGIFIYSIFQTLIMSLIFSYFISFMLKKGCNKEIILFSIGFYILTPIFGFYSVTMWKDILFGCFALFLMIQIYKFTFEECNTLLDKVLLVVSILLTGLFRSNGIYATLSLAVVLFFVFKKRRKETLFLILVPSILCFIIIGPVYSFFGIRKPNFIETTAIPFEQICYVVVNNKEIDENSLRFIENVVSIETIRENYSLTALDSIKFSPDFNNDYFNKHKAEFFKTWLKLLIKYPNYYIQCYLKSTYGFWYIESKGYSVHMWEIADNDYNLTNPNFEKGVKLIDYHNKFYYYPIVKYLLEPAFFVVVFLYAIVYSFINKKKKYIIPLLVPFLIWASIMAATPLSYQSRYVFALFTTFPFVLYILLLNNNRNIKNK